MKKILSVAIALLMLLLCFGFVSCDDTEKSGLYTLDGEYISWEELINKGYITVTDGILKDADSDFPGGRLIIDKSITQIGSDAFYGKSYLQIEVFIPNTVTRIGEYAFYLCNNITKVEFEQNSSLQVIERLAFWGCLLDDIFIPKSVNSIGYRAFTYAKNTIVVEDGNTVYDSRNNCNAIIETSTDKLIFGCDNTIIPNDIQIIGKEAFYCSNISNIDFKQLTQLHTIEENAFRGCNNITVIELPSSIKKLNNCFSFCENLETFAFPEDFIYLGDMYIVPTLNQCPNLKNFVLPKEISTSIVIIVDRFIHNNHNVYQKLEYVNLFGTSDEDLSEYFSYQSIGSIAELIRIYNKGQWSYQNGVPVPTV